MYLQTLFDSFITFTDYKTTEFKLRDVVLGMIPNN